VTDNRDDDALSGVARRFVSARRSASALPDYPGTLPPDLATAYAIQDRGIAAFDEEIVGWKVGRVPPEHVERFAALRLAGPIFRSGVQQAGTDPVDMPIFQGGFGAAEAEFLCRLGADAPAGPRSYTMEEAAALIGSVHVGIEIASSPYPGINDHGPAVTVSDFGNNHGLVVGEAIADWPDSDFEQWPVTTEIDGTVIGEGIAADMLDGAVGAVRFLLELLGQRGIPARKGLWVSTGAVTGVHVVRPGQLVRARFAERHALTCRIVEAG
jgi:2-keto-4-pentenoate hydratase